jgi:hypothetical protein
MDRKHVSCGVGSRSFRRFALKTGSFHVLEGRSIHDGIHVQQSRRSLGLLMYAYSRIDPISLIKIVLTTVTL